MMRSNPLYIKFKIKKHNETAQGHQTITINGGQNKDRHTTQNAVRGTVATDTRAATIAMKDHQYANVKIVSISNKRRASEGNKETGEIIQGCLKHHYYTNIDTSSGSLASLASTSTQVTDSSRYENVSLPRDLPDHTYSNQEEMGGVSGETRSHDYVNVTLTPAVSLAELT